ncbi:MAG: DsbA family protein [Candidatus Acidulodesulfobacterium acidiphilum]|uniref:DsbA family protein n=1 Tax=Candidatus Acidulodesulfobacterium acidiphilum TaxID=2597224 RepID=A0A520XFC6_9DELT|nr:MAG: DsbA family protein [Candidatus Acidulodesulfobacterium acidiphilum]
MKNILFFLTFLFFLPVLSSRAYSYVLGNAGSNVKIVEYSDYECPWCRKFELKTFPYIYKNFVKKGYIEWDFRDYPLIALHPLSFKAAEYAGCSGNEYLLVRFKLFEYQKKWDSSGDFSFLNKYVGHYRYSKIKSCAENGLDKSYIESEIKKGEELGIHATPSFAVYKNGRLFKVVNGYRGSGYWYNTLTFLLER